MGRSQNVHEKKMECMVAMSEIYNVPVSTFFVPQGTTTQPRIVIDHQVATAISASLMFIPELDIDHCDALLPNKEKEGSGVSDRVSYLLVSFAGNISSIQDQHIVLLLLLLLLVGWDLRHQVLRPLLAYWTAPDDR
jgi:hypothetical protein